MYYNEGYPSDIISLVPLGTNSTMFTACCGTAICDDEKTCPKCNRPVVGDNAETASDMNFLEALRSLDAGDCREIECWDGIRLHLGPLRRLVNAKDDGAMLLPSSYLGEWGLIL